MAKINVTKPFTLNIDGLHRPFGVGLQPIEDELAEHWYVQEHSELVEKGQLDQPNVSNGEKVGRLPPVRTRNQAAKKEQ